MFPPPGVHSTAPQNAHAAPESRNPYRNTPTNQTPRKSPQNAPQHEQPTPAHKRTRERWNEPGRLFKITFYTNPDRVHAQREAHQQTHTETAEHKKNPGNITGAVCLIYSFSIIHRKARTEKLKYIILSILFAPPLKFSSYNG